MADKWKLSPKSNNIVKDSLGDKVFYIITYVVLGLLALIILYPVYFIIIASISDPDAVLAGKVVLYPVGINFEGYAKILERTDVWTGYFNTIIYTVVTVVLSLVVTIPAGWALSRKTLPGKKFWMIYFIIPMFFGGGLIPTYLTVAGLGLTNTRWAMIIPGLISTWNLIVMRSFFIAYPQEIIESGMIDGLRDPGVFLRLVLPTSKAALATIGLYYAVGYWNNYMTARIYIRDETLYPVQNLLAKLVGQLAAEDTQGDSGTTITAASIRYASIVVVITPIMCVYPFIQKHFVKGVMVGSIKG